MFRSYVSFLVLLALATTAFAGDEAWTEARRLTGVAARELESAHRRNDVTHAQAIETFEQALALVPESVEAKKNLALALSRRAESRLRAEQEVAQARNDLDRALELHPRRLRYQVWRARALLLLGRAGDALREVQVLARKSPAFVEVWILTAQIREREGELLEAAEALEKALALAPARTDLRQQLSSLRVQLETEAQYLSHSSGNFRVKYPADADPETVRLALTILEDAYSHVVSDLGVTPKSAARVILYPGDGFQAVTMAHGWVGAVYQRGTLRVPILNLERLQDAAARVLTHEFTHHVLHEATPGLPSWWHEGIAQYEEPQSASLRLQRERDARWIRQLKERDNLLTLRHFPRDPRVGRVGHESGASVLRADCFLRDVVGRAVRHGGAAVVPRGARRRVGHERGGEECLRRHGGRAVRRVAGIDR